MADRQVPESLAEKLSPAAAETFAELGFEGTRLEDLSASTGIPRATLYYYFSGKAEILAFLLSRLFQAIAETVADAAATGGSPRQRLERVITALLQVYAAQPALSRTILPNFGRVGRVTEFEAAAGAAFHQPVMEILMAAVEEDEIKLSREDVEATAVSLFGAVTMTAVYYLVQDDKLPMARVKRSTFRLLDGIWATDG